jgi:NADPH:quinone reductase-like Zn-dependent oxidoreductase
MRAVFFKEHGGPDRLELGELPDPRVGPNDVRVRVKACALNHLDLFVRGGLPNLKLPLPHILGSDVAGIVESVGAEVRELRPGASVVINPALTCGHCLECVSGRDNFCREFKILGEHVHGGYAELLTVPAVNVHLKPDNVSFEEAATVPLVFMTAFHMVMARGALRPEETVLVQAAGSGIGSAAIQIARVAGARVIATSGTEAKLDKARALGAHEVINYEKQDVYTEVKRLTGGRGVNLVVEHVGAATWKKSVACLAWGGRLVTCGATTGFDVEIDLRHLFIKQQSILGSTMGTKAEMFEIVKRVAQGAYRPVLDRVLPLFEARKAHELLADRAQFGKIVLVP